MIDSVSTQIEDNRPIEATITVASAVEKAISITVSLTIYTADFALEGGAGIRYRGKQ